MSVISFRRIKDAIDDVVDYLVYTPENVSIELEKSLNKISGENFSSKVDLPPYPKSTMDGYALRHTDISGASRDNPIPLKLIGSITMPFKKYDLKVREGECVFIETGCFLPSGTDAVVRIEDTYREGGVVYVMKTLAKYENVSLPGEELKRGDPILKRGIRIKPWHIAALRLHGVSEIEVLNLRVLVVGTGDEFLEGLHIPFTLSLVRQWFIEYGFLKAEEIVVGDNKDEIKRIIRKSLPNYDMIVLCGGTSLGMKDYLAQAIKELSPDVYIHGIALKPGRTTILSAISGKPVIGISGLPVAAYANLELVISEILRRWLEAEPIIKPRVKAILTRRVTTKSGVRALVRVRVYSRKGSYIAEPLLTGGSGSLRSLLLSNGYLVIPEDVEGFEEGEVVEVVIHSWF